MCLKVRLSKTFSHPIWFALKQLRKTETMAYGIFTQKYHLEASGFNFRSNLNFKGFQLREVSADLQDSGVEINLKSQEKGYLTKCPFSASLFFKR